MRVILTIVMIILIIVLGFMIGTYMYKIKNIDNKAQNNEVVVSKIDDECTAIAELNDNGMLEMAMANASEKKVSPQCTLTIKKLYTRCNHVVEVIEKVPATLTNLNAEEFQEKYKEWEIQKFTEQNIILYKEEEEFCNQHYSVKDVNGYIGIYELDEDDREVRLIEVTNISTEYLTETDLIKIQKGIVVYTDTELNKLLEDFE